MTNSGILYIVLYKKCIFLNMSVKLSKRLTHFLKTHGNLWKVIAMCNGSKNTSIPQFFFLPYLIQCPKSPSVAFKVLPVHFNNSLLCTIQVNECFYNIQQMKDADFWTLVTPLVTLLIPPMVVKWWDNR